MSNLADHARALRVLADELRASSQEGRLDAERVAAEGDVARSAAATAASMTAWLLAEAHARAADRLDAEVRAGSVATAEGHRCTVDHSRMTTPRCPACGAAK